MKGRNYKVLLVNGKAHIICNSSDRLGHKNANYMGTGKALCGILSPGETLSAWIKKREDKELKVEL
jgi:hypothetical protein